MDRTNELEEQVQRLTGEVDEMRARMARLERDEPGHQNGTEPKNRRGFLKFGAGAVLGALGMAATKVLPAAALTGNPTLLGTPNAAGATTGLTGDGTVDTTLGPNPTLRVTVLNHAGGKLTTALSGSTLHGAVQSLGGDAIPPIPGPAIAFEGIDAFASGSTAWGVYGLTDAGTGVVGESNTGIGLYARRSGRIRQEGLALAGAPSYSPNSFEQVRDASGVLWIHGTPANSWRRVNSLRTDTADGLGNAFKPLRLVDTRLTGGPAVNGTVRYYTAAGAGAGASAIPSDAIAVVGNLTANGFSPAGGWLTITPKGVPYDANADPSSMNFSGTAYAWANSFICGLGTGANAGQLAVYVYTFSGTCNFIVDITGYIQ
ncbi:MAG TPA: bZIP transcription factor [Candidatus Dormibacteraeota bacterium]|nr:bZIP transcription factor [Candidatus Dormibacteraeota bacterium]